MERQKLARAQLEEFQIALQHKIHIQRQQNNLKTRTLNNALHLLQQITRQLILKQITSKD